MRSARYNHVIRWHAAVFLAACVLVACPGRAQVANAEMQTIAQAMDMCAIDTTYYVVPEALNDLSNASANPAYNYIGDQGGTYVLFPQDGFFRPTRINLATAPLAWNGPYVNFQPGRTQLSATPYDQGAPLDPWGGPYYLFSPLGLLRGDSGTETLELYGDQFDRYALVSLGLDAVKSGDDVIYLFSTGITSFRVSSLRLLSASQGSNPLTVTAGSTIIVRGTNLGATQSGAKVFWGATELTNITAWSAREITVVVPQGLEGTQPLTVQRGAANTNSVTLTIQPPPAAGVEDWALFE